MRGALLTLELASLRSSFLPWPRHKRVHEDISGLASSDFLFELSARWFSNSSGREAYQSTVLTPISCSIPSRLNT